MHITNFKTFSIKSLHSTWLRLRYRKIIKSLNYQITQISISVLHESTKRAFWSKPTLLPDLKNNKPRSSARKTYRPDLSLISYFWFYFWAKRNHIFIHLIQPSSKLYRGKCQQLAISLSRRQLKTISARYYSSSSSGNWPLERIFRQKGDEGAFSPDLLARFCREKERKRRDLARGRNAIDRTFGIQLFAEETTTINWLIIGDHWPNLASVDVIMHLTNEDIFGWRLFSGRLTRNMMDRAPMERMINVLAWKLVFPVENLKIRKLRLVLLFFSSLKMGNQCWRYWILIAIMLFSLFFLFLFFFYFFLSVFDRKRFVI